MNLVLYNNFDFSTLETHIFSKYIRTILWDEAKHNIRSYYNKLLVITIKILYLLNDLITRITTKKYNVSVNKYSYGNTIYVGNETIPIINKTKLIINDIVDKLNLKIFCIPL